MNTTQLGKHGPHVSVMGLGLHGHVGYVWPSDRAESIATIHAALDQGVTLLDTGDFYGMGHNEMLVGEALRPPPRTRYMLSVKFGALRGSRPAAGSATTRVLQRSGTSSPIRCAGSASITSISIGPRVSTRMCRSKRRLAPSRTWSRQDYVRYIGLSEVGAADHATCKAVHPICDLQIEYSLVSRGIETRYPAVARELGSASRLTASSRAG